MKQPTQFDFMYAVRKTKVLCAPQRLLEVFDQTSIKYTLIASPMDNPNQTRVREGTLQTFPPRLVLPGNMTTQELEGFGPQAQDYLDFLKAHAQHIRVLQYSYRLRREAYTEVLLSEPLEVVRDRVKAAWETQKDPAHAIVQGVDEPWDVCLLHLFMRLVQASIPSTLKAMELREKQSFRDALPKDTQSEVERAFAAAQKDPTCIKDLGQFLKKQGLFEVYQDRFFALLK